MGSAIDLAVNPMKISLRIKLTVAFISLALALIVVFSFVANSLLEQQFTAYIVNKLARQTQDTVTLVNASYQDWGGQWDEDGMHSIGSNALLDGLIVRFEDLDGNVLWDAKTHDDGMCSAILEQMAVNMQEHTPGFEGGYQEVLKPITDRGLTVGYLAIGYYGPYFFSEQDLAFLGSLNKYLLWLAALSSLASLILGQWLGRRISKPITEVIETTEEIAAGNFSSRASCEVNTREIVDLTDAVNKMGRSLEEQETIRQRLTSDVAHELRTPIATLQSHLEAMIDGVWPADTQRLTSCHEETVRLTRLVGDLELLMQFENQTQKMVFKPVDLDILIRHLLQNFENEFRLKSIRLLYEGQKEMVDCDSDKLSQVLVNLVSNALKYTNEGGLVKVRLTGGPDQVSLSIEDTGVGISDFDLPHIFNRFYRADQSRDRETGGSGIGLTIARAIVRAHHGVLLVKSKLGAGSAFTVNLPRKQRTDRPLSHTSE